VSSMKIRPHHCCRDPIALGLVVVLTAGLFLRLNEGPADNNDYIRAMGWITSGPATMQEDWPAATSEQFNKRFFRYWIPYWKLDWPGRPEILSSTALLWLPGALLNSLFYSRHVVYQPILSILPRLLFVLFLVGALRWVDSFGPRPANRSALKLAIGVPLAFAPMATDYVRMFNTFYLETGTFVYLLLFLASLVVLHRNPASVGCCVFCSLALALLATAKVGNIYWPLFALPFLLTTVCQPRRMFRAVAVSVTAFSIAAAVFPSAEIPINRECGVFQSLYHGLLTFSRNPRAHLARLQLDDTAAYLGQHSNLPGPSAWLHAHPGCLTYLATLRVLVYEPAAGLRAMHFAAKAMQGTAPQMGTRAEGDTAPRPRYLPQDAWCQLKVRCFPRGFALFVALSTFAGTFMLGLSAQGVSRELSLVGLVAAVACFVEMAAQVLGAGTLDLTRHLLVANFLFDLSLMAFLGALTSYGSQAVARAMVRVRLIGSEPGAA
jgi:hypothetical protein